MVGSLLPRARDGRPEGQGWGIPARGRGQSPPSGLDQEPASAPRLRAQQPGKGPEAGQESTISAVVVGGCPTGEARKGHWSQWWEPGQSRLQRERPEAGAGPESPGWLGSGGLKDSQGRPAREQS